MSRKRSAKKKSRRAPRAGNNFSATVKALVWEVQDGRCGMCRVDVITAFHHRQMRSQQGSGDRANCLGLCVGCHTLAHHRVGWSYRHGLLVRATGQPRDISCFADCGVDCETNHTGQ